MPPKWTVDYILSNPEVVFDSTAHELAQATYTSLLTIVRLCKKLGTKGYPDFQLKLALDYQRAPAPIPPLHHSFTEQGDVLAAIDSVPSLYNQAEVLVCLGYNIFSLVYRYNLRNELHTY
ncbi:MurR/RpiR family transcriptional regulator [Paenibacillus sp. MABNR03]|uniref:MurR/RpiR family transcriptional regulator n=1 Tax=Paenibacillus sp. MABNR03 TaxID=3142626 RepID=UPI003D2CE833